MYCDKTNESSADILIPYERKIHVLFSDTKNGWWGTPLVREIVDQSDLPSFKNDDFSLDIRS